MLAYMDCKVHQNSGNNSVSGPFFTESRSDILTDKGSYPAYKILQKKFTPHSSSKSSRNRKTLKFRSGKQT